MAKKDYMVGYGRPPLHTRFKPGQSGNPNGRTKGSKLFTTDMADELARTLNIKENQQTTRVTKQEAIIKRLLAGALSGDARFMAMFLRFVKELDDVTRQKALEASAESNEQFLIALREGNRIIEKYQLLTEPPRPVTMDDEAFRGFPIIEGLDEPENLGERGNQEVIEGEENSKK